MANQTKNYELTKPLASEFYDVEVQNGNMDKIDAALKENADGIKSLQDGQKNKADLVDGKVPTEQLPEMNYDQKGTAESKVKTHNEDEAAHPYLLGQINTCVEAAQNAQEAADAALDAVSDIAFTINAVPTQNGALTYTGSEQTPSWNSYDPNKLTIGGTIKGTDAGNYTATFTPKEKYKWSDGTQDPKEVVWTIGRASMPVPSQSGSLTYTGATQSPTWANYDSGKMTIGGTTSGTNAGSYNATFTPGANYKWNDGTTDIKTVPWTIGKAAGSLSLSKSSMSLNVSKMSDTITVTRAGGGTISAVSSAPSVASVSVSGNVVTVTAKAKGNATVTVSVAADANHTAPANKTCSVSVTLPTSTLNDNDWSVISQVSNAGKGSSYWSVGDTKSIVINGKVGNFTFSNLTINAFILGFNHNSAKEGTNRIHFQIGKIGSTAVALCDSKYNTNQSGNGYFNMNPNDRNQGGWKDSYMRNTLLGNTGNPTSPPANTLLAALPSALRSVMKSVSKYTDNVGNDTGSVQGNVTSTTDYLFLLAEWEVFGSRNYANSYEQNYQVQYDYYKAGNSKVAYNHTSTTSAVWWWLRSPCYTNNSYFCSVNYDGYSTSAGAYYSAGVRPGFAV